MAGASPSLGTSEVTTITYNFLAREALESKGIMHVYDVGDDEKRAVDNLVGASKTYNEAQDWLKANFPDFSEELFALCDKADIGPCIEKWLPEDAKEARSQVSLLRSSLKLQGEHYTQVKESQVGDPDRDSPFLWHDKERVVEIMNRNSSAAETSRRIVFKVTDAWDFRSDVFVSSNYLESVGTLDGCRVTIQEEDKGYSLFITRPIEGEAGLFTHRERIESPLKPNAQFMPPLEPKAAVQMPAPAGPLFNYKDGQAEIGPRIGGAWKPHVKDPPDQKS